MGKTSIEWTNVSWNPFRGCSRVNPDCDNCYAMFEARRHDHPGGAYEGLTKIRVRKGHAVGLAHPDDYRNVAPEDVPLFEPGSRTTDWSGVVRFVPEKLGDPLRWKGRQRVFVASMSDPFHPANPFEQIAAVFGVMAATPQHTYQLLTKRPEVAEKFFAWYREEQDDGDNFDSLPAIVHAAHALGELGHEDWREGPNENERGDRWLDKLSNCVGSKYPAWPLPNVHLLVSCGHQAAADKMVPVLLRLPAAVRGVSYEPATEEVDFSRWLRRGSVCECADEPRCADEWIRCNLGTRRIDWLIIGGESGRRARPFAPAWARKTITDCRAAGVPVFFKQAGRWLSGDAAGFVVQRCLLADGSVWVPPLIGSSAYSRREEAVAFGLAHKKGGDMAEWPEDLRVREYPS